MLPLVRLSKLFNRVKMVFFKNVNRNQFRKEICISHTSTQAFNAKLFCLRCTAYYAIRLRLLEPNQPKLYSRDPQRCSGPNHK